MITLKIECVHVLLMGGCVLFGEQEERICLEIGGKWGDLIAWLFSRHTGERAFSSTFSRTRRIFAAAADAPAHGETGVREPLANTVAHSHAVSHHCSYHHQCYSLMIIIKVSHCPSLLVLTVERGVIWLNLTKFWFVLKGLNCNL